MIGLLRPAHAASAPFASSQAEVEASAHHRGRGAVRHRGRARAGRASSFGVAWRRGRGRVFIEHNDNFVCQRTRDAGNHDWPGYRHDTRSVRYARRAADEAPGKKLFFGNRTLPKISSIRLVAARYVKESVLLAIDLAGRAIRKKKAIRTRQTARTGRRADAGSVTVYLCGGANRMAKGVEQALPGSDCRIRRYGCQKRRMNKK